ncbi:MAG TPA: hypothetical protein VFV65_06780 [Gemmatimonadales bacterium]|nr:hypothetical protein [Gemmatimonadales bacterium]
MPLRRLLCCLAFALAACAHEDPFEPPATGSDRPFLPGTPARLTYNAGADLHPAWTPDGSSFLYAWQHYRLTDVDRCLSRLSAAGGSGTLAICNPDPAAVDSADFFDYPSLNESDQLLFVRSSGLPGAPAPNRSGVYLGELDDPLSARLLITLPSPLPGGGGTQATISTARWLSRTRVMYVAQSVIYSRETNNAPLDTLVTGLAVVEMDLSGPTPVLVQVPGTGGATSLALNESRDAIYFTLLNDTRVLRLSIASGQLTVAHDFGARGIARDVTVLGNRLVAVVGGEVEYQDHPILGPLQLDGGGTLVSVDLTTGAESDLPWDQFRLFRHPEFVQAGDTVRLVVEGYPSRENDSRNAVVSKVGDLFLYVSP